MTYSRQVLDHFQDPRNIGELPAPSAVGRAENPICGDLVELSLAVSGARVVAARFRARACAPTIACCSALTELLPGTPVSEAAARFTREALTEAVGGLPPASNHAAELTAQALRAALVSLPATSM